MNFCPLEASVFSLSEKRQFSPEMSLSASSMEAGSPHPRPIRRGALLFNLWDSRAEGMATAVEEMMLHAGYYDDNPRAREIVLIMLAQRAARGLASLYAHVNQFDLAAAKAYQVEWTPRGWMRPDLDLLGFEQQLYLRQPGYGTSYVTCKHLIEELVRARARQLGDAFTLRGFFDELNAAGMMPVSLIHWQLTSSMQCVTPIATKAEAPILAHLSSLSP